MLYPTGPISYDPELHLWLDCAIESAEEKLYDALVEEVMRKTGSDNTDDYYFPSEFITKDEIAIKGQAKMYFESFVTGCPAEGYIFIVEREVMT